MNAPTPAPAHEAQPAPRRRGCIATTVACVLALFSGAYLVNPTLGVFEFLPDNLPIVGNLDEAFFTLVFFGALTALGIRVPGLHRR
ncbi:MAG: hypothetical protein ACKOYN_02800 [Planctomycetota bacterium]